MKPRILVLLMLFLFSFSALHAQQVIDEIRTQSDRSIAKDNDTLQWNWKTGGTVTLGISQGSLSNWSAGGDNFSFSGNFALNYYFFYKKNNQSWDNNLDVNVGYLQTSSLGSRKNGDKIDYLSKYGQKVDSAGKWYVTGLFNLRTQMFSGYTYNSDNSKTFTSSFLSPAYVVLSAGMDYHLNDRNTFFLSPITSRWVIVMDDYLASQASYGVDSGKHVLNEIGAFMTISTNNKLFNNCNFRSRVDLFSNYLNKPQNLNFYMTNQLNIQLNKFLTFTYNLDLIYDDKTKLFGPNGDSPALQLKSLVGLGISMPLSVKRRVM